MRVLHVHSGNILGGIETMLLTLARERRRELDVDMSVALCFGGRFADLLSESGAVVSFLGEVRLSRRASVRRARAALKALLARIHPDVVVMHAPWTQLIFGGVVKQLGYPLVAWVHGPPAGWMARAARFHKPDAVLCNSAFIASLLPRGYRSIPHAVLYYPSPPPPPEARHGRQQTRRALGASGSDVVVVQVSRLDRWKGHEVHLRAAARLRDVNGWKLWFAGGPQRTAEIGYEKALRALAARLGIAERVTFLGQREDVRGLLAAADIYCQPNTAPEPFGLSYVEALAAGLPVIASDLGAAKEIVTPETGILSRPCDVDDLEAALRRLIGDAAERERLGRNGPARAAALCDPARQVDLLARFLGQVAGKAA